MGRRKMKITVLLGGDSAEREVSISSGLGVIEALRSLGHKVSAIDPALDMNSQSEPERVSIGEAPPGEVPALDRQRRFEWLGSDAILSADVVFVGLHGGAGEDGTIQAQFYFVAFTDANLFATGYYSPDEDNDENWAWLLIYGYNWVSSSTQGWSLGTVAGNSITGFVNIFEPIIELNFGDLGALDEDPLDPNATEL